MLRNTAVALALVLVSAGVASAQQPAAPQEPLVVVTGDGAVQAVPDRAWITIGAESHAATAREAQRRNSEAMTPVQDKLRAAGIPQDAIRTSGYDVQYEWDMVNGRRVGRGYVARNSIDVRVDNVERVGELMEMAVGSGATSLSGVRFDLKDRSKLEREALRLAVADARSKADAAAAGAGRSIERIIRIDEQDRGPGPVPIARTFMKADAAADAVPPIAAGQIELRATVSLTAVLK